MTQRLVSKKFKIRGGDKNGNDDKRRINAYTPLDGENPYEDLRGKIQ